MTDLSIYLDEDKDVVRIVVTVISIESFAYNCIQQWTI
jgi:hypothetical protein